jgi:hypothetical protein
MPECSSLNAISVALQDNVLNNSFYDRFVRYYDIYDIMPTKPLTGVARQEIYQNIADGIIGPADLNRRYRKE